MVQTLHAACGCHTGKIRTRNEDNLYFAGKCLEETHQGLKYPVAMDESLNRDVLVAVFDGMGGENFGHTASYAAARQTQQYVRRESDFLISQRAFLEKLTTRLNHAVVLEKRRLLTDRMGTTMAALYFSGGYVYNCNVGDSRAYRLRGQELIQISRDHIERLLPPQRKKPALTQCLGIEPEQMQIEPCIAKGRLEPGDVYLLCSDGLTDMLSNLEISEILLQEPDPRQCADRLIRAALDRGGKDNITVIVCRIDGKEEQP